MSYNQYEATEENRYGNAPSAEAGYARQNNGVHSPSYPQEAQQLTQTSNALSQQDFLARVDHTKSEIRTLTSKIQEIAALHQRALSSPDTNSSAQLEHVVTLTQLKNTAIRDHIKQLEADSLKTQDGTKSVKSRQVKQLKSEFERSLNEYRKEELGYRQRYRDQIAREYRIVNPDASEAEVEEASRMDWGSEGVFQTALKSNRSGQASSVLGAVRARHNELQRIEATLTDLADMFAEMAQVVEAQEPVIEQTEQNAIKTTEHIDKANVQIDEAKKSAARARKLKWYCLLVTVLIIIAIALGVGLGIGLNRASLKSATMAVEQPR